MRKNFKNLDLSRRETARTYLREMGVSERVFWELARKERLGFSFRRQVPVDKYILDFYCAEASVCVEIDGELHELQADKDQERDGALRDLGIETYRIPSLALFDTTSVRVGPLIEGLVQLLEQRSGRRAIDLRRLDAKKRQRWYGS